MIGILTAVTVVSFTGITQRAPDSAMRSTLAQTVKAYTAYLATGGTTTPVDGQVDATTGLKTILTQASIMQTQDFFAFNNTSVWNYSEGLRLNRPTDADTALFNKFVPICSAGKTLPPGQIMLSLSGTFRQAFP